MSGKNSTNLKQTKGGEVIKQGDSSSIFEYELLDYDGNKFSSLDGKNAKIKIANAKGKKTIEAVVESSKIQFKLEKFYQQASIKLRLNVMASSSQVTRALKLI